MGRRRLPWSTREDSAVVGTSPASRPRRGSTQAQSRVHARVDMSIPWDVGLQTPWIARLTDERTCRGSPQMPHTRVTPGGAPRNINPPAPEPPGKGHPDERFLGAGGIRSTPTGSPGFIVESIASFRLTDRSNRPEARTRTFAACRLRTFAQRRRSPPRRRPWLAQQGARPPPRPPTT